MKPGAEGARELDCRQQRPTAGGFIIKVNGEQDAEHAASALLTIRMGPVTASPPMGRRHKTSGDRRCRDETAFVPAKQAIPVARDPVIGPVADTPRQQQEYSRPGPAGQAGKNEDHGVGFEICVAIDNGDVSLGLATSTARRVASADPRVLWIAMKRNRALASRSIRARGGDGQREPKERAMWLVRRCR
jgi:hypothetical protein